MGAKQDDAWSTTAEYGSSGSNGAHENEWTGDPSFSTATNVAIARAMQCRPDLAAKHETIEYSGCITIVFIAVVAALAVFLEYNR